MKIENAKARPAGVSLVITIIFVSAFMLILADMYQVGLNMIRNNRNAEQSGKAEYFVRSAEEVAALIAGHMEDGTPFNETQIRERQEWLYAMGSSLGETNCGNGTGQTLCAKFEVKEEASLMINLSGTSYYPVPATVIDGPYLRGTGTAGKNCDSTNSSLANNSCHWNKLLLGESVEIPLGVRSDGRGEDYNEFKLRVRTPECSRSSESSASCERAADNKNRFVLYPRPMEDTGSAYRDIQKDKVLVQWSITGEDPGTGRSVTLVAAKAKDDEGKRKTVDRYDLNTEISAGRINKFNNTNTTDGFSVLEAIHKGQPISVESRSTTEIFNFIKSVKNPTLRLTLVTRPSKSINNDPAASIDWNNPDLNIPFLEYQLLTKCSGTCNPPKDSKYIITGKATIGEYTKYFTKYINRRTTLGGFVLENF